MFSTAPPGIELVAVDEDTLSLASPTCVMQFSQVFIRGTAPTNYCPIHEFGNGFFLSNAIEGVGRTLSGAFSDQ